MQKRFIGLYVWRYTKMPGGWRQCPSLLHRERAFILKCRYTGSPAERGAASSLTDPTCVCVRVCVSANESDFTVKVGDSLEVPSCSVSVCLYRCMTANFPSGRLSRRPVEMIE